MYTECSSCHTYFKITPAQLKIADGQVRCGNCGEVFNALDSLVDVVPPLTGEKPASSKVDSAAVDSDVITSAEDFVNDLSGNLESSLDESNLEDLAEDIKDDVSLEPDEVGSLDLEESSALDLLVAEESDISEIPKENDNLQEEINKDIDDALNDLFNDEELKSQQHSSTESKETSFSKNSVLSEVSAFGSSEIKSDDFSGLGSGLESENQFSTLDVSEAVDAAASEPSSSKVSSSFGAESTQTEPNPMDFDLGESVLASDSATSKNESWDEGSGAQASDERPLSSEDYVLEELQEKGGASNSVVSKIAWVTLIIFLLLVLLVQFAYLKRAELVKYPSVRPALEIMCTAISVVMKCEIPEPKDTDAISLVERNVVSHPNAKNALLITSVIKNNAGFTQPYPKLVLTFSDINQKVLARRTFIPSEYLTKDVNISSGMAPSVPIKIMLEIVDPGQEAVNFEFDFK